MKRVLYTFALLLTLVVQAFAAPAWLDVNGDGYLDKVMSEYESDINVEYYEEWDYSMNEMMTTVSWDFTPISGYSHVVQSNMYSSNNNSNYWNDISQVINNSGWWMTDCWFDLFPWEVPIIHRLVRFGKPSTFHTNTAIGYDFNADGYTDQITILADAEVINNGTQIKIKNLDVINIPAAQGVGFPGGIPNGNLITINAIGKMITVEVDTGGTAMLKIGDFGIGVSANGELVVNIPSGVTGDINGKIFIKITDSRIFLDHQNVAYRNSEALGVSNYPYDEDLPLNNTTNPNNQSLDPENFRLSLWHPNASASTKQVTLEVIGVSAPRTYTLDMKTGFHYRSKFLRLVSNAYDDGGNGYPADPDHQRIRVKLGDTLRATYDAPHGGPITHEISVGRPSTDPNNNDPSHKKHDIREIKVNITVFKNSSGTECLQESEVDLMVDITNEYLAQSGIRLNVIDEDIGANRPTELQDGIFNRNTGFLANPTPDEIALMGEKDGDYNSVDIFVVAEHLSHTFAGTAYNKFRNQTTNTAYNNWIVLDERAADISTNSRVLAHELMHILINSGHRADPQSALFYDSTPLIGNRIGPYPAATSANVGADDTTVLRTKAEALP